MTKKQRTLNSPKDAPAEDVKASSVSIQAQEEESQDSSENQEDPSDQKEETRDEAQTEAQVDEAKDAPKEVGQSAPATAPEKEVKAAPTEAEVIMSGIAAIPVAYQIPTNTKYFNSEGKDDGAKAKEMNALVIVQFIEDLKGCVTIAVNFEFEKYSQWRVPKWFAMQHGKRLVVRG